jgi:hypothetical protein
MSLLRGACAVAEAPLPVLLLDADATVAARVRSIEMTRKQQNVPERALRALRRAQPMV